MSYNQNATHWICMELLNCKFLVVMKSSYAAIRFYYYARVFNIKQNEHWLAGDNEEW